MAGKSYKKIGCFVDKSSRAIPYSGLTFGGYSAEKIAKCATLATCRGFSTFAVQYGGQCFTGPNAQNTYSKYGAGGGCHHGRGELGETMSIYLVSAELYSVSVYLIIRTTTTATKNLDALVYQEMQFRNFRHCQIVNRKNKGTIG